ncbi:MAG: hypothetical protein AAFR17_19625 [Pseudomonadota bacterium]
MQSNLFIAALFMIAAPLASDALAGAAGLAQLAQGGSVQAVRPDATSSHTPRSRFGTGANHPSIKPRGKTGSRLHTRRSPLVIGITTSPYLSDWERRRQRRERRPVETPPETPLETRTPPAEPEPTAPEVLDPRGPRFAPARTAGRLARTWRVGERLPARIPIVTLDWRRYDLAEPGAGTLYARVDRSVLLIDAVSRRIFGILPREAALSRNDGESR